MHFSFLQVSMSFCESNLISGCIHIIKSQNFHKPILLFCIDTPHKTMFLSICDVEVSISDHDVVCHKLILFFLLLFLYKIYIFFRLLQYFRHFKIQAVKIFIFDTETTGFIDKKEADLGKQPYIIQFAGIM
jgi:hypothetical protein